MKAFLIISLALNIILLVLLFLRRAENRRITRQIKDIRGAGSNSLVHTSYSVSDVEEMAKEINLLLEKLRKTEITGIRKSERLDMMLANISHDLRTPLTSALGYIDIIRTQGAAGEGPDAYDETVGRDLEIVKQRLHRLSELIDSFFEFSKIVASDREPDRTEINLTAVLEECIAHYYDDYNGRGRAVVFDSRLGRLKIASNRNLLMRIFDNLINNALKHGTGDLKVEAMQEGEGKIVIRFVNEAELEGIEIEHIFDEFYTRDISRTSGNTGLGLAIAREFTELLGGTIAARAENRHLEIAVTLPVR